MCRRLFFKRPRLPPNKSTCLFISHRLVASELRSSMALHLRTSSSLSRTPLLPSHFLRTAIAFSFSQFNRSPGTARFSSSNRPPLLMLRAQAKRTSLSKADPVATPADLQFEVPLKIVEYPDPKLRAPNKRINTFDENLKKLVDEMFDVMYKTDGIGLSAPQVGVNVQLMVFNPVGEPDEGEEIVLVNPKVYRYSKKKVLFNEGCLSFPRLYGDVERPESVRIDARDITGARFTVDLSGLPARVFQHEFDHLKGVLFFERMTEEVLDSIREGLQALEKKYEDRTGLPSPEKVETRKEKPVPVGFGKS